MFVNLTLASMCHSLLRVSILPCLALGSKVFTTFSSVDKHYLTFIQRTHVHLIACTDLFELVMFLQQSFIFVLRQAILENSAMFAPVWGICAEPLPGD